MDVTPKDIVSRAGLDVSPSDAYAKRRAKLEDELEALRSAEPQVRRLKRQKRTQESYFLSLFLLFLVAICFVSGYWLLTSSLPFLDRSSGFYAILAGGFFFWCAPVWVLATPYAHIRMYLLRKRIPASYDGHNLEELIRERQTTLAELTQSRAASAFYLEGLAAVREELLGSTSPLVNAKAALDARLSSLAADLKQLGIRVRGAKKTTDDLERETQLRSALRSARNRSVTLRRASERAQLAITRIEGILSGYEAYVCGLAEQLEDEELIRRVSKRGDVALVAQSDEAIEATIGRLRGHLLRIEIAVQESEPLLSKPDEDLNEYFHRVEAAAMDAAELEAAEAESEAVRRRTP